MDDLVELSRFGETSIESNQTTHRTYQGQNRWRVEVWLKDKELGRGSYGAVWLEKEARGRDVRAVKQIRKMRSAWDYGKEISAMARLKQFPQYFAYMHGWFESKDCIYLAMDYFHLGDLSHHLDVKIPEEQAKDIARELCRGLRELHRMGFTHRDLKPQNIFVVARSPAWSVRIGDFGISKRMQENETSLRTMRGTLAYMAPEMIAYFTDGEAMESYSQAVDMWALGIILFQMLILELAFNEVHLLHRYFRGRSAFAESPLISG